MEPQALTPILNVSNIVETFAWFAKLGWRKGFDWGSPPTFGSVCAGKCEIFLCQGGQGSRGRSALTSTAEDDTAESGMWMSIWVDDVDAMYRHCVAQGLDITMAPRDEPWGVREMHVRHPDGHVFRISRGTGENEADSK